MSFHTASGMGCRTYHPPGASAMLL